MTESRFYSDRTNPKPRGALEELPLGLWNALVHLIRSRVNGNWFAEDFPEQCPDGRGVFSTDSYAFGAMLQGLIPNLSWPLRVVSADPDPWSRDEASMPAIDDALDLVDFVVQRASEPTQGSYHKFPGHYELRFDRTSGRNAIRGEINELFRRNGIAYQVDSDLRTRRTVPIEGATVVAALLEPRTSDATLDKFLADAMELFRSTRPDDRRLALDRLFAAFERLKTITALGAVPTKPNKAALIKELLNQVATPANHQRWRDHLELEFRQLTDIGNSMQIRHVEVGQEQLEPQAVDYLFVRAASVILYVLRGSGHLG